MQQPKNKGDFPKRVIADVEHGQGSNDEKNRVTHPSKIRLSDEAAHRRR